MMRTSALHPAQAGIGALRHSSQAHRVRRRFSQQCRAEQINSCLDKGISSGVRDDYDAVIALAGIVSQRQPKLWLMTFQEVPALIYGQETQEM